MKLEYYETHTNAWNDITEEEARRWLADMYEAIDMAWKEIEAGYEVPTRFSIIRRKEASC